jgi:hypothetical protein
VHSLQHIFRAHHAVVLTMAAFFVAYAGHAAASGFPPFAVDDSATVKRGATVSVLDGGESSVLANDFDIENDRLTAELRRKPKHGELTFFEDGTFLYRHDGSSKDSDEFRYRAFDGTGYSREVKVRISIVAGELVPPAIVGQNPVAALEDGSVQIELRDLQVVDPDNDYPADFFLEVADGENYTRVATTITPIANFNGQLIVPVRVNDGMNFSDFFDLRVDVVPQNDAPFVVAPVPDQEAAEGVEFALSVAANFDDLDDGDILRFSASGLPASGAIVMDTDTGLLRGTPIREDARDNAYSVSITATDSAGASAELSFALLIFGNNRADLAVSSSVGANPTLLGDQTLWSIEIENQGPAQLEQGELLSSWTTSGPTLTLAAPAGCTITSNDSPTPALRCVLPQLAAGESVFYDVQGMQAGDGDNTLIASLVADDPVTDNNTAMVSAQVAIAFSEGPTQTLNQSGMDVATADFNSDGLLDLAVTGNDTRVYFNAGNRSLQTPGTTIGGGGSHLALLDWNADGLDDVAVAGPSAGNLRIFLGTASGAFADSIEISTQVTGETTALEAIDADGDGASGLVMAGTFGTLIARNRQLGMPVVDTLPGGASLDIVIADLNQDGFEDIAAVAAGDRRINLLRNMQNGTFALQGSFQQGSVAKLSAADLDGDGDSDLLLAIDGNDLSTPYTQLMLQQSDWNFVPGTALGASTASDLLSGDLNADGQLDIVTVNSAGVHQVYVGSAGGEYTLDAEQIVSPGMQTGTVADFNADNSLDLVLVGANASVLELHANNGIGRLGPGDITAPELSLIGAADIAMPAGAEYIDEGATAMDDIDGDITDTIVISGAVNTTVVGTYTITYRVSDRASNASQVSRRVVVGVNQGAGGGGGGGGVFSLFSLMMLASVALFFASYTGHPRREHST